MKNLFSLIATLVLCISGFSQDYDVQPKKNIIKTNLTSLAFRNYQISYERSLSKTISINATYGFMPEGEVPFLDKFVEQEDIDEVNLKDINLKSNTITAELRFYTGAGYGKGFYVAPYYRRSSFQVTDTPVHYPVDIDGIEYDVPLQASGKITSNNAGLLLGTQFLLGRNQNFVLDFWFLGAHYGIAKGDLLGTSSRTLTQEEQDYIKNDLLTQDIPLVDYEVTTTANSVKTTIDGPWAGLRGGLAFGFRF